MSKLFQDESDHSLLLRLSYVSYPQGARGRQRPTFSWKTHGTGFINEGTTVHDYVCACQTSQQKKTLNTFPARLLQPLFGIKHVFTCTKGSLCKGNIKIAWFS